MPLDKHAIPSSNFSENLHYMDCDKPYDGLIRVFFKAMPNIFLGIKDPTPEVQFVCALVLEDDQVIQPQDIDEQDALDERARVYFNSFIITARAVGVAKNDWKPLSIK